MKKKSTILLGVILCAALCCSLLAACNSQKNDNEETTVLSAQTVEIGTADQLFAAAQYVGTEYSLYTLRLTADIDLSGKDWTPIGLTYDKAFTGVFDGNGHTISGLTVRGWDENGKPLYIAKKIVGRLADGTLVYDSTEIISVSTGETVSGSLSLVNDVVYEGDDSDPNYEALSDDDAGGEFETGASYGSVGLFGYTRNAQIKNLTVSGADISFYTSGDCAYAGVVSGYDDGSLFDTVTVADSKIGVSTIYEQKIKYFDYYGTPESFKYDGVVSEYLGGVVGYAKSNTVYENGETKTDATRFDTVGVSGFVVDNANYSAYYNGGLEIYGDKADSKLVVDTAAEKGYVVTDVKSRIKSGTVTVEHYPVQVYSGGVVGYSDGADFDDVSVDGLNESDYKTDGSRELADPTPIIARSVYAAGVSGYVMNGTATNVGAKNVYYNGIYWKPEQWSDEYFVGLVYDKATFGGVFGLVGATQIDQASSQNFYAEVGGDSIETVCIGGLVGYAYDDSSIKNATVDGMYAYSSYTGDDSEELGSIMAGAAGVLRNASLEDATVKNAQFEIKGHRSKSYSYVRGIVSQIYGESVLKNSSAESVSYGVNTNRTITDVYGEVNPVQYKNNYVNEDGYTSARLYYTVDGEHSGVYVTVYGELVPFDANDNSLIEETIYEAVDFGGTYTEGAALPLNEYYYYDAQNDRYNAITDDTLDAYKLYSPSRVYATKKTVYRVEFASEGQRLESGVYYEYDKARGKFDFTADTSADKNKTYYIAENDSAVSGYYLDITVYTESGKKIIVDRKDADDDDDDILAEAVYVLTKDEVVSSTKTAVCGGTTYNLSNAEIYSAKYFTQGVGFIADKNGFTIKYYDGTSANRDFSKYSLVTGRPTVENIQYK